MALSVKTFPKGRAEDYDAVCDLIQSGDVLLCSGSAWFSKMIQRATDSVWSHVGFVMQVQEIDRLMVLESVESIGVRTVPLRKYLLDYDSQGHAYPGGLVIARHDDFASKTAGAAMKKLGQFAVDLFGYPYDNQEIAKIAARIAASMLPFSRAERKSLVRDREYICSEYVWECYQSVGINVTYNRLGFVAPADFARDKKMKLQFVLKTP